MDNIKTWIINHDDSKLFIFLYISLAVVLSIVISLFWLIVVVLVHFIFECIKQSEFKSGLAGVLFRSSWELILDFGLIFFAFVIAIYMDIVLGAAGIGAGARASVQAASRTGTRFAGWQRAIRGILLSLDDVAQVSKAITKENSKSIDNKNTSKYGGWVEPWSFGDKTTLAFTFLSVILIITAPFLTYHTLNDVILILMQDLKPLP